MQYRNFMSQSLQSCTVLRVKQDPKLAFQFKVLLDLLYSVEMNHLNHWNMDILVLLNTLKITCMRIYFVKQLISFPAILFRLSIDTAKPYFK